MFPSYIRLFKFRENHPSCIKYLDLSFRKRLVKVAKNTKKMEMDTET